MCEYEQWLFNLKVDNFFRNPKEHKLTSILARKLQTRNSELYCHWFIENSVSKMWALNLKHTFQNVSVISQFQCTAQSFLNKAKTTHFHSPNWKLCQKLKWNTPVVFRLCENFCLMIGSFSIRSLSQRGTLNRSQEKLPDRIKGNFLSKYVWGTWLGIPPEHFLVLVNLSGKPPSRSTFNQSKLKPSQLSNNVFVGLSSVILCPFHLSSAKAIQCF